MVRRILITGVNGFIGKSLTRYFMGYKDEFSVAGIDLQKEPVIKDIEYYPFDVTLSELPSTLHFDYVIHLAGQPSVWNAEQNPRNDFTTNVTGSINIILSALKLNAPVIFLSTIALYESRDGAQSETDAPVPRNWYGMDKMIVEQYLEFVHRKYNLPYVVFRAAYLYDKSIERGPIADLKTKGNLYKFNCSRSVFDFIHTEDLFSAILKVIKKQFVLSSIFNMGSGTGTPLSALGEILNEVIPPEDDTKQSKQLVLDPAKFKQFYEWEPAHNILHEIREIV